MWKILPLLVCDSPTVAKVYMYASQGDLGINHDMILMDSLLRALCRNDFTAKEKAQAAVKMDELREADQEDAAQYLVRAYAVKKTRGDRKCAQKLLKNWATEAGRYNLDDE